MTTAAQLSQMPTKFSGLRYMAFKSQVLVSSGVTSLDFILGGGIPLGSVMLIEEDEFGVYSEVIMKYFYAEANACSHSLFVASPDSRKRNIIYQLPQSLKLGEEEGEGEKTNDYKMKIAWRYQSDSKPSLSAANLPNFGHQFDLSTSVPPQQIDSADITLWPTSPDECASYEELLRGVGLSLCRGERLVRIGLHSLGSSLWSGDQSSLPSLIFALRSLIHNNPSAVLLLTIPVRLIKSEVIMKRCEDLCDTVIALESLANNSNPLYSDYKGLIKVLKYPALNTLAPYQPEPNDWAFKLHRKKFVIEKLHLPPDIESSEKKEANQSAPLCSRPMGIDF